MTLPHGFTVRLDEHLLHAADGTVLVGGSPLTALHLSPRAQSYVAAGSVTVTDAASAHVARRLLATNLGHPDHTNTPPIAATDVTVVIPVRDRAEQLDRALTAIGDLACIVVDDASHDPAATAAVCTSHGAQLLALDSNVGPAGARNAGLIRVQTPYVAFVDSDVQVTATDLLTLCRHFADPDVALVGPRIEGRPTSAHPRWFERYDAQISSLTLGSRPSNVRPGATVAWLPSACLVARVDALAEGFDPTMRIGEDVDLVWRTVSQEQLVRYDPAITARHDTRPTIRAWLGRKFLYGSGGAALAARHGNKVAPAVLTPEQAVAAAGLLLRRRWGLVAAVIVVARGAASVRRALPADAGRAAASARISARGLGWAGRQESALVVRHWWPATLVAAVGSRRFRQGLVTALVVDSAIAIAEARGSTRPVAPVLVVAGRRLEDLAYGAGLCWGALRHRSAAALLPRRP